MDETGRAEVDEFDLALAVRLDQDVLGLQVAVDESETVQVFEGVQDLFRDLLELADGEVVLVIIGLFVEFRVLVEILL